MAIIQTRYTYPMVKSKNVRLSLRFLQKYHVNSFEGNMFGGINIDNPATQRIDIYRFDGRSKARFDMSSYDKNTRNWSDSAPDFERQMAILGYTKVFEDNSTAHPNQFIMEEFGRSISYDLDTNNPVFATPALYQDVWWITDDYGQVVGPVTQHFRLESRVYAPSYEPLSYWFDMTPYPDDLPWQNAGYPICVGVSPIIKNAMNRPPYAAMRTLLSKAHVVIVDGYRIEDDYGVKIDPHEYYNFNVKLNDQIFNYFFGIWNTVGLPAGTYKVRYRIRIIGGDKMGGTLDKGTPFQDDYWKTVRITKLRASKIPPPIALPYDSLESIPAAQNLYPFLLSLDKNEHRFTNNFVSTVSHFHEPRIIEPVYQPSSSPNAILSMDDVESSVVASTYELPNYPSSSFTPMVFMDGALMRPSDPIDGSGTLHDYYITGKTVRKVTGTWTTFRAVYGYKGYSYPGGFVNQHFATTEAVLYGGNYYFLLDKRPNGSVVKTTTQDTILSRPADYKIHVNNATAAHFGKSVLEFTPTQFAALRYWVSVHYTYGVQTSGATPANIQTILDTSGEPYTDLPRNMNNTYPIEVYHGGTLVSSSTYTLTVGSNGDPGRIDYDFTPTLPIMIWFN